MLEEIESLQRLPKGQRVVGCQWVYKKKEGNIDVENARFKAHLVAQGYTQKQGVDSNEVFSLVAQHGEPKEQS